MSRTLTAIAIIAGALLTYLMGAAAHWSLDPGDWSMKNRGVLVFLIWPMASAIAALAIYFDRDDWR